MNVMKSMMWIIKKVFRVFFLVLVGVALFYLFANALLESKPESIFFESIQCHINVFELLLYISTVVLLCCFVVFVLLGIYKIFRPSGAVSRKQTVALIFVTGACACCLVYYAIEKGGLFGGFEKSSICVAWRFNQYESIPCDYSVHPMYRTEVVRVTAKNASIVNLRKILVDETTLFFDPVKRVPIVYYYRYGSTIEFFDSKGVHPLDGGQLLPATPEIIEEYFQQIYKNKTE